jgi:ATP-dependent DNA helicase DinG
MNPSMPAPKPQKIALPDVPVLTLNARHAFYLNSDGELQTISHDRAAALIHKQSVLVCHAPYVRGKLDKADFYAFDILELFAFIHPGSFAVPTPHGLCKALGLPEPENFEDSPLAPARYHPRVIKRSQKRSLLRESRSSRHRRCYGTKR